MNPGKPHYLLDLRTEGDEGPGRWRFSLQRCDAPEQIEVQDAEPQLRGERLELLALIRALESLDEPARISLVGGSRSLHRGILYGLPEWRDNGWCWEYFGQMVPIKNGDLWQRLDRALQFHRIECRQWRLDPPHTQLHPADEPRRQPAAAPTADPAPAVHVHSAPAMVATGPATRQHHGSEHYNVSGISDRFTVLRSVLAWARWAIRAALSWFDRTLGKDRSLVPLPRVVTRGLVGRESARR